ncbi:MAG: OmpA family protein [Desulfobacterales bacterium]|nr:OmpA family protein [Desulfobacterales bacterium]
MKKGRCTKFGECSLADNKMYQSFQEGHEELCQECGSRLIIITESNGLRIAIIFGIIFVFLAGIVFGVINFLNKKKTISNSKVSIESQKQLIVTKQQKSDQINLSLDQWIGWRSILMANGGLDTKDGSIFNKLGLRVNIKNIDDNEIKLNALMSKSLDAMGSTINRYAFEFAKLKKANIPVKMIIITNTSDGGDGIIAQKGIKSIEDLAGKRVALARFTEAQCLLEWCLQNSSLSTSKIESIRNNLIFTDDAGKAGETFFAGKADAAATWQPFLTQATNSTDGHILVDTKTINNFILDGIIFREDFIKYNRSTVEKFIRGIIEATNALTSNPPNDSDSKYSYLVDSFPMCANLKKEEIEGMFPDAHLSDYTDNVKYLSAKTGLAEEIFKQSSQIWKKIGELADPNFSFEAFDNSIIEGMNQYFQKNEKNIINVKAEQRELAISKSPILTKQLTINFQTGKSTILEDSYAALSDFSLTAKMAERSIIQIEGNTDNVGNDLANQELSAKRARAVAMYLQYQGIDPTRFITIGNGSKKPIASNGTKDGRSKNRRTDIMLKEIETHKKK